MNEETGITSAPGSGETAAMDARGAAAIMQQARERAGSELRIRRPVLFVTWGVAVLIGYGAMWLSVRGQHPFHGPAWPTLLLALLLLAIAAIIPAQVVDWAASGVGGRSEIQRGIFVLALAAGYGRYRPYWGSPRPCSSLAWCSSRPLPARPGLTGPGSPWASGCWPWRRAVRGRAR